MRRDLWHRDLGPPDKRQGPVTSPAVAAVEEPAVAPAIRMAHPDPKVIQTKRIMAHPVRRGPIGAIFGAFSGGSSRDAEAGVEVARRRRDLTVVLILLLLAAVVSAGLPGGWIGSTSADATQPTARQFALIGAISATPTPSEAESPSASPSPLPSPLPSASASPSVTAKPAAAPMKFVALGDSLTAWPAGNPWPTRLDGQDARLVLAHNAGVPGDTTAQMLARFTKDVAKYDPQVLFILGGTNDLGRNVAQATIIANLRAIIVAARAKKMRIFMLTIPPQNKTSSSPAITSLNVAITHLANGYKIVVINIHAILSTSTGVYQAKFTSDGLHFSSLGAQTVANYVYSRIHRLGY